MIKVSQCSKEEICPTRLLGALSWHKISLSVGKINNCYDNFLLNNNKCWSLHAEVKVVRLNILYSIVKSCYREDNF